MFGPTAILTTPPGAGKVRLGAGIPLPVIQQQLGHESITTTVNTYGHLDRSLAQAAADAIGAALS
jgi:integrase